MVWSASLQTLDYSKPISTVVTFLTSLAEHVSALKERKLCVSVIKRSRHRRIQKQRSYERVATADQLRLWNFSLTPLAEHVSALEERKLRV